MRRLAPAVVVVLAACWWHRAPGPAPLQRAQGPVATVLRRVDGPVTWVEVAVRAGSAHDPIGKEGLASLTAELLRQGGGGGRTPEQVDAELYALGTDVEVVVDKELVTFRSRALSEDVPVLADLVGDLLLEPALDPGVFARLRAEASDWLVHGVLDDDESLGLEVFDDWIFSGHPYGHPVRGRAGVLPALTVVDVRQFIDARYVRPAITLGVAGPSCRPPSEGNLAMPQGPAFDPASADGGALSALRDRLSTLPARLYEDVTPRRVATVEGRRVLVVEKPTAGIGVHFGAPIDVNRGSEDWPALALAFTALGEHRQSHGRLYRALRGERGLNYGDYAYPELFRQQGWSSEQETGTGRLDNPFVVWLRPVSAENGSFALRAALSLVDDFVISGLEPDEFERMKRYFAGRISLWAADPGRRLGWAVEATAMGWPDPIDTLPGRVDALTLPQVNDAITRHVHADKLRIVVVAADGAGFASALSSGQPTPMVAASPPPEPESARARQDAVFASYDPHVDAIDVITTEDLFR